SRPTAATPARPSAGTRTAASCCAASWTPPSSTSTASAARTPPMSSAASPWCAGPSNPCTASTAPGALSSKSTTPWPRPRAPAGSPLAGPTGLDVEVGGVGPPGRDVELLLAVLVPLRRDRLAFRLDPPALHGLDRPLAVGAAEPGEDPHPVLADQRPRLFAVVDQAELAVLVGHPRRPAPRVGRVLGPDRLEADDRVGVRLAVELHPPGHRDDLAAPAPGQAGQGQQGPGRNQLPHSYLRAGALVGDLSAHDGGLG